MTGDALDAQQVRTGLGPDTPWSDVRAVPTTGSTSSDVADLARDGTPEGLVLLAAHQSRGRGRLGRSWTAPPGTSLACSALLRPEAVPVSRWSWLSLLAGVAVAEAVDDVSGVSALLKWPNDVLVGDRKLAGILAERIETPSGHAVVLGVGLNVTARPEDLPEGGTSLAAEVAGRGTGENPGGPALVPVAVALLRRLGEGYRAWTGVTGDPAGGLAEDYRRRCGTLGRRVRADLPGGTHVEGTAVDLDAAGRLVVRVVDGRQVIVGAGDVVHLR
ncbi:MAG TPA: biotin--[acetyl-CoA-carboxylase] ligase [Jiangellales bacterium]|nr:biotin--[acetyl-CoA-carboxylase] ligase [Jiangellales bacterium]